MLLLLLPCDCQCAALMQLGMHSNTERQRKQQRSPFTTISLDEANDSRSVLLLRISRGVRQLLGCRFRCFVSKASDCHKHAATAHACTAEPFARNLSAHNWITLESHRCGLFLAEPKQQQQRSNDDEHPINTVEHSTARTLHQ